MTKHETKSSSRHLRERRASSGSWMDYTQRFRTSSVSWRSDEACSYCFSKGNTSVDDRLISSSQCHSRRQYKSRALPCLPLHFSSPIMRLSALAVVLAAVAAAALPGRAPLDDQHPFDSIVSKDHPGHPFPDPPTFPPPSGHETIYDTLRRDTR